MCSKLALSGKVVESREKMIELIKVYGMSESDFLKYINCCSLQIKTLKLGWDILETIAKYDYRILVGANPEIQLICNACRDIKRRKVDFFTNYKQEIDFQKITKTQREGFEPPYACAHRLSRPAPYRARRPLRNLL